MPTLEKDAVRIHYEEAGSGYPLLMIAGGGLNSTIADLSEGTAVQSNEEFKSEYRCITADLRNANSGQSSGPLEIDRPWDAHADDQLGLMDHLGIDKFMVLGFCIGGPLIWNLLKRAPDRVVAAVLAQPSGFRPEMRDFFYNNNIKGWAPELIEAAARHHDGDRSRSSYQDVPHQSRFRLHRDARLRAQVPDAVLILPDDVPAHPYAVAMEGRCSRRMRK